ncbi:hypothetical protein PBT90_09060 [Algoriphagus halophytocola]|uniref:Uncharacterized protein n=1 Tax=Algoriphagus halophytocola TaxID=2991499 RepID=A0ABY6MLH1_9BACT|nr:MULTISPECIES: hypothetical protein [unclassified Algoriphagus]UZD23536.1 hypothetical protein OM944_03385 [Algoriphagus sp. TR-M5]WBL44830.1 hypothetical protein PBT90_09060 [Algoriphagus sp. TR-M9]
MEKSTTKIFISTLLILLPVIFYTSITLYLNFTLFVWITGISMVLIQLFYIWKLIRRYSIWYTDYMFDEKMAGFRKKVEKPRIFFYSIFWPLMCVSTFVVCVSNPTGTLWKDVLLFAPFVFLFIVGVLILDLTWKKRFENRYIPLVKNTLNKSQKKFRTHYTSGQLEKIFDGLLEYGFIEYLDLEKQKSHREQFVVCFGKGTTPSTPLFDLNIPVIDAVYFFDELNNKIDGLSYPTLAKIFLINGKAIKPGSLRSSKSISKNSRSKSEIEYQIDGIFSKIH